MQSHPSCHHSHLVVLALVDHLAKEKVESSAYCFTDSTCLYKGNMPHLSLSNMEILIAVVDDGTVLATGSDIANTLFCERKTQRFLRKS